MRVVPVSIADKGLLLESVTAAPLAVRPDKDLNTTDYVQTEYLVLTGQRY
jgi:hypothetical protein